MSSSSSMPCFREISAFLHHGPQAPVRWHDLVQGEAPLSTPHCALQHGPHFLAERLLSGSGLWPEGRNSPGSTHCSVLTVGLIAHSHHPSIPMLSQELRPLHCRSAFHRTWASFENWAQMARMQLRRATAGKESTEGSRCPPSLA